MRMKEYDVIAIGSGSAMNILGAMMQSQISRVCRDTSHNIERHVFEFDGNCQKRKSIPPAETS